MSSSVTSTRIKRRRPDRNQALSLTVEGYKAVRDRTSLRIAPLTIIAGANSSGKSSFMQPFLLMKQTLDSAFDPGPLLLYGPNVRVTDRSQVLSRGKSRKEVGTEFTAGMRLGSHARAVTFGADGPELTLKRDAITREDEDIELSDPLPQRMRALLRKRAKGQANSMLGLLASEDGAAKDQHWDVSVSRNRCFLNVQMDLEYAGEQIAFSVSDEFADDRVWVNLLRGIIHVPGLRGNPERSYSRSAVGTTYPGTFETYVASIVYDWTTTSNPLLAHLSAQLEALGLTWKLVARRLNDASIELLVGRMQHAQQGGANDVVSVADVGFGVSQTLPVLVALLTARPGQIVYLEQPEIHLHPRAQLALADVLVEAAARGVRVIAETHSSLVIRGIQTAVAERRVRADQLSFNWFGRDRVSGFQTVTEAQVDESGRFGEWPVDFDDVSRDADWAFLDAIEARS